MWLLGGLLAVALLALLVLGVAVWGSPLQRWSAASATSAALLRIPDPAAEARVAAASQPAAPTPELSASPASILENSASIAEPRASSVATDASKKDTGQEAVLPAVGGGRSLHAPAPSRKPAPKAAPASPLERRGNERYGRFD
jgi:hypothetical protein